MRVLPFTKYSPCGNTTILVRESSLSPADRARVAAEIIAPGHLEAEQAGYVDTAAPVPRLDMMGGEFCVNATRAFAALLAEEGKLSPESGGLGGIVSVSGMPERLRVRVRRLAAHCFESAVLLDLPQAPPLENVAPGMYLVRVPGIAHLVLDAATHPLPADKDRDTAALFARFGLLGEDAAGCIWLHREPSGLRITPFVWVRGTGTTYAETACGSGTLAASIVCRGVYGDGGELSLMQPGGEPLRVVPDGSVYPGGWAAWVGGPVRCIARGDVFVECLDGEGRAGHPCIHATMRFCLQGSVQEPAVGAAKNLLPGMSWLSSCCFSMFHCIGGPFPSSHQESQTMSASYCAVPADTAHGCRQPGRRLCDHAKAAALSSRY